jgi:acetolactate synthase-1/2/3 large subunit
VADAYGIRSWRIADPADLAASLRAAFAFDGPALIDILIQPLQDASAPVSEWVA